MKESSDFTMKRMIRVSTLYMKSNPPFYENNKGFHLDLFSQQSDIYDIVFCSDVSTMPIVDKLKEALKPGRKETGDEGDLNKLLASSAKKVLLQKIEFEPASKGFSYQLDSLKNKYVILNPRNEAAVVQKATEPAQIKRQGKLYLNLDS